MATYFISGDVDQACAELKTTLQADEAKFAAELNAHLNAPPMLRRAPAAAPAPIAKPAVAARQVAKRAPLVPARNAPPATPAPVPPRSTSVGPYLLSRSRNDDSLRGRLRTTLRMPPKKR